MRYLGAEMSALLPKDIAAWHRSEARKYQELANFHKKTADAIDPAGAGPRITYRQEERPAKNELTLDQFEKAVADKGGRVNHLAARLHASEESIWTLLKDPTCKYAVGDRGFIYEKSKISQG